MVPRILCEYVISGSGWVGGHYDFLMTQSPSILTPTTTSPSTLKLQLRTFCRGSRFPETEKWVKCWYEVYIRNKYRRLFAKYESFDNNFYTTSLTICNDWENDYAEMLTYNGEGVGTGNNINNCLNTPITLDEVLKVLNGLKNGKAVGVDNIHRKCLKKTCFSYKSELWHHILISM